MPITIYARCPNAASPADVPITPDHVELTVLRVRVAARDATIASLTARLDGLTAAHAAVVHELGVCRDYIRAELADMSLVDDADVMRAEAARD